MPTGSERDTWALLEQHRDQTRSLQMRDLFAADPGRADRFSRNACGLYVDYSKQRITGETISLLMQLARTRALGEHIEAMFRGDRINVTEGRAVLHTALRRLADEPLLLDGVDIMPAIEAVRVRMANLADKVRDGQWRGWQGAAITDIVHIGIGGSHLGPQMACEALRPLVTPRLRMHFVSSVDGSEFARTLRTLAPATTLFIIASKSFATEETMTNAQSARSWFLASGAPPSAIAKHFVAVSSHIEAARAFGIEADHVFGLWDWVGGRFSLWSAIGLPVMIAIGPQAFRDLMAGARAMDGHFRQTPFEANLPVILALLDIWNVNCLGAGSHVMAPYNECLRRLPSYLQQLEMESNGKSVCSDGMPVAHQTSPMVWGETGIHGQHAYFQLLHQGTQFAPVDFIAAVAAADSLPGHQAILLANALAQAEALMRGKSATEVRLELSARGIAPEVIEAALPHRTFPGNRPSTFLLLDRIDPHRLGSLIALYEHKVFVEGVLWGINSFDQWGVELGKQLAGHILTELSGAPAAQTHDASTAALIARVRDGLRSQ